MNFIQVGLANSTFSRTNIGRCVALFRTEIDLISPSATLPAAWNAKFKADFSEVWNGSVEILHKGAVSTSDQVLAPLDAMSLKNEGETNADFVAS